MYYIYVFKCSFKINVVYIYMYISIPITNKLVEGNSIPIYPSTAATSPYN